MQEGSIPPARSGPREREEMARLASLEGPEGRDARVRFAVGEKVRDLAFEKRKALSDVQIALTPNVTEDGFRLIRTPAPVFAAVEQFYNASHATQKREEDDGGPLYNQHQITTWHTPLPPDVKRFVFDELQKTMEAWAPPWGPEGDVAWCGPVETGDLHLHGYRPDPRRRGIMNVAQDDDWPVEILDHGGKLPRNMKPVAVRVARLCTGGRRLQRRSGTSSSTTSRRTARWTCGAGSSGRQRQFVECAVVVPPTPPGRWRTQGPRAGRRSKQTQQQQSTRTQIKRDRRVADVRRPVLRARRGSLVEAVRDQHGRRRRRRPAGRRSGARGSAPPRPQPTRRGPRARLPRRRDLERRVPHPSVTRPA